MRMPWRRKRQVAQICQVLWRGCQSAST